MDRSAAAVEGMEKRRRVTGDEDEGDGVVVPGWLSLAPPALDGGGSCARPTGALGAPSAEGDAAASVLNGGDGNGAVSFAGGEGSEGAPPSSSSSDSQPQRSAAAQPPQRRRRARSKNVRPPPAPAPAPAAIIRSNNVHPAAANDGGGRYNDDPPPSDNNNGGGGGGANAPASANAALHEIPPFPWATNRIAHHHSIAELHKRGITTIEGEVKCQQCNTQKVISYNIADKFGELTDFIFRHRDTLHDRAPARWTNPTYPDCEDKCLKKNCVKPVIPKEKELINWLFLLLGQTLGLCTLDQLKHFCAHNRIHRTGAKDRVLFSTYFELCDQLCPNGPFNIAAVRKSSSVRFKAS